MVSKRKQKKSSVSAKDIKEYAEKSNSVRISYHEKVCAERMKTLFKAIDEMRLDIKNLRADMNKGKGAVGFFIVVGGLVATVLGFFKWNG
jgi:translation initiation factor 1 (eIF-1/SUI1)|tara:strand:+ start:633 stop:902 length:270 start_codon:yes stop_codon:yes gene_type:complete